MHSTVQVAAIDYRKRVGYYICTVGYIYTSCCIHNRHSAEVGSSGEVKKVLH